MQKKLQIATLSFRSIRFLTPKPNHLSFEVCDSVGPSNVKWRGLSYAAASSAPSEPPESQKGRKRVSKQQRRAIVESFVNKHRSENAGKFPTITDIQKQVGGGFYSIREIIKELEYKSKMKSSNNEDEILLEKLIDKSKRETTESVIVSSDNIETSREKPFQDDSLPVLIDGKETVSTGYEHLEESLSAPSSENYSNTQGQESEFVDTENHKKLEKMH
uniref:AT3G52170-like helix-turn-helix domain-containing protein n=1 Tax=Lotus japonicus TaxID=34305 RepID=I3SVY1_LOTJA|nr:unknown [Lotus japonicus]